MSTRNRRSSKAKRARRRKQRRLACAGMIVGLFFLIYLGGCAYFGNHFFPNTKINGIKCGMASEKKAFQKVSDSLSTYELTIHSEEGDLSVKATDVGLAYKGKNDLTKILKKQEKEKWFLSLTKSYDYQAMETSLNEDQLTKSLDALACMNPSNPRVSENATITYNKKKKSFQAKNGKMGNQIDKEAFFDGVKSAMLAGMTELDLATNEYYLPGEYTKDSEKVKKAKKKANSYLEASIHIEEGDKKLDVSKKDIASFISINEDYKVSLNEKTIEKYVKNKVCKKFDNIKSMNIVDTPGSGKVYIANGDGGKAVDPLAEKKQLIEEIKAGKSVTREPTYVSYYLNSSYGDIIKEDYIDINLSDQMVYVVLEGKIAKESPCVTGNVAAGRSTPTGIYRIAYKTTNYTMVKYNAYVNYWMPYDTRYGIGLHDATWRSQFGGDIYKTDGSHGCINLPLGNAAEIYRLVYKGLPVMVHY